MGQLKKLAGQTAIYGASSIVGRLLNWLLTPFYTGVLDPEEFGEQTVLYGYSAFLLIIFTYGLETTYFRFATRSGSDGGNTYGQVMTMILLSTLAMATSLWLLAEPVAAAIQYPDHPSWVRWFAAIIAIDAVTSIPFARLRLEGRPVKFAVVKILVIIITILLNIFFFVIAPSVVRGELWQFALPLIQTWYDPTLGVEYIFVANFLASACLVPLLGRELLQIRFQWQSSMVKKMLQYSLPVAAMGLAGIANENFGRLMIKYLLPDGFYGPESSDYAAGVYGACFKLSVFMNLGIQAFRYAAEPFFFSSAADKNSPQLFSKVMKWFVIFGALVFLAVSVNLDWIGLVLQQEAYREALYVVPFLLMGYLFLGVYYNLSVWYKLTDKTYYGAYIAGIGAVVTVVGNILLIPVWGYFGAAIVNTVSYLLMAVISYFLGEKHYPVPYKVGNAAFYLALSAVLVGAASQVPYPSLIWQIGANNLIVIGFIIVVVVKERSDFRRANHFIS